MQLLILVVGLALIGIFAIYRHNKEIEAREDSLKQVVNELGENIVKKEVVTIIGNNHPLVPSWEREITLAVSDKSVFLVEDNKHPLRFPLSQVKAEIIRTSDVSLKNLILFGAFAFSDKLKDDKALIIKINDTKTQEEYYCIFKRRRGGENWLADAINKGRYELALENNNK
ncbi:MAG TPA: hypothetical protein GX522_02455 [Firmicutes bacterium]|nr:hypothetical protein [Bacillota bacterium]